MMQRLLVFGCVVSLLCCPLSTAEAKKPPAKTAKSAANTPIVVRLTLTGGYPEGPGRRACSATCSPRWHAVIDRLDEAAADKDVAAVWLRIEDLELGRGEGQRTARAPSPGCARPASRSMPN